MWRKTGLAILAGLLILGCQIVEVVPSNPPQIAQPGVIGVGTPWPTPPAFQTPLPQEQAPPQEGNTQAETQTPPTPLPEGETTAEENGGSFAQTARNLITTNPSPQDQPRALALHGWQLVFLLPVLILGSIFAVLEFLVVRYVQPRGLDLSEVLIKAKDGLFILATVSMTARRTLSLASLQMTWPRARELVEKAVEQELIDRAIRFENLEILEQNLKPLTQNLAELEVVEELRRDFGVQVLRFNIEIKYTPETVTALNDKAEASAGGQAYLAYAAAAHLDPNSPECRELYQVYQQTTSQVDAARSLGGGISGLVGAFGADRKATRSAEEETVNE